jgi:hypothetical protein
MKQTIFFSLCLCFLLGCSSKQTVATAPVALTWEMGANGVAPGQYDNTFFIKNTGTTTLEGNWVIYFAQSVNPVNPEECKNIQSVLFGQNKFNNHFK